METTKFANLINLCETNLDLVESYKYKSQQSIGELIYMLQQEINKDYLTFDMKTGFPLFIDHSLSNDKIEKVIGIKAILSDTEYVPKSYTIMIITESLSYEDMDNEFKWFNYAHYGEINLDGLLWILSSYLNNK